MATGPLPPGAGSSSAPPGWLPPVPGWPAGGPEAPLSPAAVPRSLTAPLAASGPALATRPTAVPRIAAYLLDIGLATMLTFGVLRLVDVSPERLTALVLLLTFAGWAIVRVAGPMIAGESPGKRMLQLRTVDASGAPIPTGTRALRELVIWLIYWVPLVSLVDAFVVERGERRSMRDRMAGTYVVHTSDGPASGGRAVAVLLLAVATLGVSWAGVRAVGNSSRQLEQGFVAGCVNGGLGSAECQCIFDQVSADLPRERLVQADRDARLGRNMPPDVEVAIRAAGQACIRVTGRPALPSAPA